MTNSKYALLAFRLQSHLEDLKLEETELFLDQLFRWYSSSVRTQHRNKVQFDLTFYDYIMLFPIPLLNSILNSFRNGRAERWKASKKFGFVLGWSYKGAKQEGVMNKHTGRIMFREESIRTGGLMPGEEMPEKTKQKIAKKLKNKAKTEIHRENISLGLTGHVQSEEHVSKRAEKLKGRVQSEESNAKRRATMLAKKLAEKELIV